MFLSRKVKIQTSPPSDLLGIYSSNEYRRMRNFRRFIRTLAISLFIAVLAVGGWSAWKLYRNAANLTHNNNPLSLLGIFRPVALDQTNGRTNILLAGYSTDDPGHDGANLTDSIMILSLDKAGNTASVISIPRDLYVNIPGYGYSKINEAYVDGQKSNFSQDGYAYGGMGLLEKVVEQTTGIHTNYYTLIDYSAFKSAVDAVGGITITINSSDPRGLFDPNTHTKLPNGTVTLSGQQALNLARARGDTWNSYGFPNSDFDRTKYQQAMLLALKTKASSSSVIANPFKIGNLADSIGNNVKTDLQVDEMETVYSITKNMPSGSIKTVTLNSFNGKNYLRNYASPTGQSTLISIDGVGKFTSIKTAIANLLAGSSASDTNQTKY